MATQASPNSVDMSALSELAPAKVNLSLEIRGRRADGYHELASLVAFAEVGDTLHLSPGTDRDVTLATTGPFASAIDGDNLILRAAQLFLDHAPQAHGGHFVLDKRLPVASGIGGGSSDAAAAIRLLARANAWAPPDWRAALIPALSRLGADIPVCLDPYAAWMQGIGERIAPLETCPALHAVLVNPGIPLATRDVFAALNAPALAEAGARGEMPRTFASADELVGFLRQHPNDLEPPARRLAPAIAEALGALAAAPDCAISRLSGSGPTCFGLFTSMDAAAGAAEALAALHPEWWVMPTQLA